MAVMVSLDVWTDIGCFTYLQSYFYVEKYKVVTFFLHFRMKPQYVRFVVSSNKNLQRNTPTQGAVRFNTIHRSIHPQNSFSSVQVRNRITSIAAAPVPTRIIITSKAATFNLSNEILGWPKSSATLAKTFSSWFSGETLRIQEKITIKPNRAARNRNEV